MIVTVFDTETTGIPKTNLIDIDKQPEIIEFVSVRVNLDTGEKQYCEHLIKPTKLIPKEITEITTITDAMVRDEKPFSAYIDEIKDALENTDAVIAHNLSFDHTMVRIEMQRCGKEIKWPRMICTVEHTVYLRGYRLSLTDLHKELFNEPFAGAHRARQDVDALLRCVEVLYKRGSF